MLIELTVLTIMTVAMISYGTQGVNLSHQPYFWWMERHVGGCVEA